MKFKQLLADDEAVSPVIGVILMVAITVILAAVIGTFVLGLGDQVQDTSPQASFSFDYEPQGTMTTEDTDWVNTGGGAADPTGFVDTTAWDSTDPNEYTNTVSDGILTITHDGGDKIDAGQMEVTGYNDDPYNQTSLPLGSGDAESPYTASDEVGAGESVDIMVDSGDSVRVIWKSSNGETSATLGKWDGPNA